MATPTDDPKAGAGPTPPTEPDPNPSPDKNDVTVLKVYGKDTTIQAAVSGAESEKLVKLAQKGAASDQRFEESQALAQKAKEDTERAAEGIKLLEAVHSLQANPEDVDAFQRVATAFGYTPEATAELARQARSTSEPTGAKVPDPPKVLTETEKWARLPKEVQVELKKGFRTRMAEELEEGVATDAVLGENRGSESQMSAIVEMVKEEATRLMVVGDPDPAGRNRTLAYGPEVVRKAVEKVRQRIEDLGTLSGTDQLPAPGVGKAPSGGTARHPAQKPKRVPMTDPKYGEYFQERLQYEALKG